MGDVMNRPLAEVLQQLQRDFSAAQEQVRQQHAAGDSSARRSGSMRLAVDTIETTDAVWYFMDLPGMEKSDLQVCAISAYLCRSLVQLSFLSPCLSVLPI